MKSKMPLKDRNWKMNSFRVKNKGNIKIKILSLIVSKINYWNRMRRTHLLQRRKII